MLAHYILENQSDEKLSFCNFPKQQGWFLEKARLG